MPLFINTNVSSINAQRQMVKAGAEMDKAMTRLSSGMRINSAKDDAAGLAISNRQTSQIRGLDQAVRNANDGVSLIQTAEGALGESTNILQRMRELAVQSANGIYGDADRATLDAEVKQLTKELDRIAKATSFNGQNILDGSVKKVALQVGSEAGQTIDLKLQAVDAKTLGMGSLSSDLMGDQVASSLSSLSLTNGDLLINGQSVIKDTDFVGSTDSVEDLINKINTNVNGVTASMVVELNASNVGTGVVDSAGTTITLTKLNGATSTFNVSDTKNLQEFADKVNSVSGGAISATIDDDGKLSLMAKDAQTLAISGTSGTGIVDLSDRGRIVLTSDNGDPITIERGATGSLEELDTLGFREIREAGTIEGAALVNDGTGAHEALSVGELKINGVVIDDTDTASLQGKINNINAVADQTGVTAKASSSITLDFTGFVSSAVAAGNADNIVINGNTYDLGLTATNVTNVDIATAINSKKEESGVSARVAGSNIILESDRGAITLGIVQSADVNLLGTATGLQNIKQEMVDATGAFVVSTTAISSSAGVINYQAGARLKLESTNGNPISIELSNDADAARLGLKESNNLSGGSFGQSISSISIDTAANASKALEVIDNALSTVNEMRSQLGAVNNRLDFTVSNLMNVSENTSAARSRITDADFAAESANLSRSQVLAQASQAMLAQANAKPQQVLSLLR